MSNSGDLAARAVDDGDMSDSTDWPTERSAENTPQDEARSEEHHHDADTEEDTVSGGAPEDPE